MAILLHSVLIRRMVYSQLCVIGLRHSSSFLGLNLPTVGFDTISSYMESELKWITGFFVYVPGRTYIPGREKLAGTYILVIRVNCCSVLVENSKPFVFSLSLQKKKQRNEGNFIRIVFMRFLREHLYLKKKLEKVSIWNYWIALFFSSIDIENFINISTKTKTIVNKSLLA